MTDRKLTKVSLVSSGREKVDLCIAVRTSHERHRACGAPQETMTTLFVTLAI